MSELQRRAESSGVDSLSLEEAVDSDEPKDAVVALILDAESKGTKAFAY